MERRQFLLSALVGTAAVSTGIILWPEESVPEVETVLDEGHRLILQALVPVVLEGCEEPDVLGRQAGEVVDGVEALFATLPPATRRQLGQLLDLMDQRLGLLALTGSIVPMLARSPEQLAELLQSWRHHFLDLLVQAYQGFKELIMAAWYGDPAYWPALGYRPPSILGGGA